MDRSKQKKLKTPQRSVSKKKNNQKNQWSERSFKELYPENLAIFQSSSHLVMNLNYKGIVLKAKVPFGIANSNLSYIFHHQIYRYLLHCNSSNPLRQTAEIVGFQSANNDLLLDYQISIGKGTLHSGRTFNCLQYVETGKLKKYKICKCLAIGGFSKVYLVRSLRDGKFYAMKVMSKRFISDNQKQNIIQNQRDICCQLDHPFIVKLNHCFQTHNFVCLVLDYCPGGQLFYYLKKIKRMSQQDARFYFIEILYGLSYIHNKKIIYRDLKPENLLIGHDGHIKIADFGLSKSNMQTRQTTYSFCGSTEYMPPQMILRQGHSFGVDFYTLGALLYELVTGLPPFYSRDEQQIKCSIVNEQLTFPDRVELSSQIKSLLSSLLNKDPRLRIGSLKGIKQILFHPWIGRINGEKVLNKQLEPPYIPSVQQFNFDENQLGHDQQEFSKKLKAEHMIPISKEKLIFNNIDFINQSDLNQHVKNVLQKYPQVPQNKILKQSHSMKTLKPLTANKTLRRQSSSPYLTRKNDHLAKTLGECRYSSLGLKQRFTNIASIRMSNDHSHTKSNSKTTVLPKKSLASRKQKENNTYNPFMKKKQVIYDVLKHR